MRGGRTIVAATLLLAGCGPGSTLGVALDVVKESHAADLVVDLTAGAVIGGVAGLVVGLVAFFALRALGGYRWEWRHAGWLRGLTGLLMALGGAAAGATAGAAQGALVGVEVVLREGQLATKVFPVVGDAGADLLLTLDAVGPKLDPAHPAAALVLPEAELAAFREGKARLDVARLRERLGRVGASSGEAVASLVAEQTLGRAGPTWRGGGSEKLLRWVLGGLVQVAVDDVVAPGAVKKVPGGAVLRDLLAGLPDAAKAGGDPCLISRADLSAHCVQRGVVPLCLLPAKALAREAQLVALGSWLLGALLVVALFRLAEWLRSRRAAAPPTAPIP